MAKWFKALTKTRDVFSNAIRKVFSSPKLDEEQLEELEHALLKADIAPRLAADLVQALERGFKGGGEETPRQHLADMLVARFGDTEAFDWDSLPDRPTVFLMIGINGSGKTTTCAKLAHLAARRGLDPVLGAADTFRAAGSSQLALWGDRIGVHTVTGQQGADAASVAFDSLDSARAREAGVLLVDTAGRMHTRGPLMEELKKIHRTLAKRDPDCPHEVWIVLDASLGQNAISQARLFHEAVPLTGVVVTKLDGSAKGGFLFSVTEELGVPVRYVGLGEGEEDLVAFDPREFVAGLLGDGDEPAP